MHYRVILRAHDPYFSGSSSLLFGRVSGLSLGQSLSCLGSSLLLSAMLLTHSAAYVGLKSIIYNRHPKGAIIHSSELSISRPMSESKKSFKFIDIKLESYRKKSVNQLFLKIWKHIHRFEGFF